eukprot:3602909-Pyramimonas_sp.AAC.1
MGGECAECPVGAQCDGATTISRTNNSTSTVNASIDTSGVAYGEAPSPPAAWDPDRRYVIMAMEGSSDNEMAIQWPYPMKGYWADKDARVQQ